MIAGHTFEDSPTGRACTNCGMRWVDLMTCRQENVGQLGWAHTGALTETEWEQIAAEQDRMAASYGGRTG